jgi:hypothetical protein
MPSGAAALPARELTDRRRTNATASPLTPAVDKPSAAFRLIRSFFLFDPFCFTRANTTTRAGLCVRRAASRARTASQTRLPRRLLAEARPGRRRQLRRGWRRRSRRSLFAARREGCAHRQLSLSTLGRSRDALPLTRAAGCRCARQHPPTVARSIQWPNGLSGESLRTLYEKSPGRPSAIPTLTGASAMWSPDHR